MPLASAYGQSGSDAGFAVWLVLETARAYEVGGALVDEADSSPLSVEPPSTDDGTNSGAFTHSLTAGTVSILKKNINVYRYIYMQIECISMKSKFS